MASQDNNAKWQNLRIIFMMELMAAEQLKSVVQIRADEIEFMLGSISRGIVKFGAHGYLSRNQHIALDIHVEPHVPDDPQQTVIFA